MNGAIEIFWPRLEKLEPQEIKTIKIEDCKWKEDEKGVIQTYLDRYRASEENRKKDIESKSTIFIGTFSVATTVLINFVKSLVVDTAASGQPPFVLFMVLILTVTIIYLCRAIWFSIKALEKQKYYLVGFPEHLFSEEDNKQEKMMIDTYNSIIRNQKVINLKADYMTMAQEYFKRAVISVVLVSVLLSCNHILVRIIRMIFQVLNDFGSIIFSVGG